jgi:hypothetical protein
MMQRKLIAALAFVGALGAFPMAAHANHNDRGYGLPGAAGYALFEDDIRYARQGIRHGVRDGSFSRREAFRLNRELERNIDLLRFYRNNDGYLSRGEIRDLRRRFAWLQDSMRVAHYRGHAGYWG